MLPRGLVAIVSGASGGIGSATVRSLLERGANVVLAAPDDDALGRISHEVAAAGSCALVVPTDIRYRDEIDRLVARTLERFGRIDVLVNLAGVGSSPSLCDTTDAELEQVVAVNLLGAARLMHAVLPAMQAQRRGSIVNVGSIAGEAGVMGIYSASKFGLRGLNDSVRREVRSWGVAVTLIEPGFVRTAMNPRMQRLPSPQIVADAILNAIARPRRRRIVPALYRLPVYLDKVLPGFTDLVFGDARVQRRLNRDARAERQA